ncbi:unnamed protein product [Nesidiocoris tenuis]|uniref:Uncharacterized protein n=1 Tax=Nesidiocoris tenuis TaxID=355587 RepID=A0A6H5HPM5_9HEMI|nr:unnamed protein product [Nesidiocoris tenuis]
MSPTTSTSYRNRTIISPRISNLRLSCGGHPINIHGKTYERKLIPNSELNAPVIETVHTLCPATTRSQPPNLAPTHLKVRLDIDQTPPDEGVASEQRTVSEDKPFIGPNGAVKPQGAECGTRLSAFEPKGWKGMVAVTFTPSRIRKCRRM